MKENFNFMSYSYNARSLAKRVLEEYSDGKKLSFPIDPFDILEKLKVDYQFRDFTDLEGVYIVPEDEDDIAIIGINVNRPVTRQRFTAAHELCHHIKDRNASYICPVNSKDKSSAEKFADKFAGELLMPVDELKRVVDNYADGEYISFENILKVAEYFGVSFEACTFRIAYELNRIEGETDHKKLKSRIRKFKPESKKKELGIVTDNFTTIKNTINVYKYFWENESPAVWYKFKNDFIYNENRLEGIEIDAEDVAEIVTDLRMNQIESEYCNSEYEGIIEIAGHSSVYDYIRKTEDKITGFSILNLHRMLFQFAPFPENAGKLRNSNNFVVDAKFETADCKELPIKLLELNNFIQDNVNKIEKFSISDFVDFAVQVHYKLTVMHPFQDGNGRVSRAMLNWLFRFKKLPPVYLKFKEKQEYYDALRKADLKKDFEDLNQVFYKQIINSMIQLNSKFI